MSGQFTITIPVQTNSDNYNDVRRAIEKALEPFVFAALEETSTITAVMDISVEKGWPSNVSR